MAGYEHLNTSDLIDMFSESMPQNLKHQFYKCKGFVFTQRFQLFEKEMEDFEVFDDDIWLCSFPKSGTTWAMEMVWSICNDINSEEAKESIEKRFPFFEYCTLYNFEHPEMAFVTKSLDYIRNMPRPRFIKTHLPWELLPKQIRDYEKKPKIIHVARNPKDAAVSFYHHSKIFRGYTGPANLFYQLFLRDIVRFGPYKRSVEGYWEKRNEPNVLFLKYEHMKSDLESVIRKTAGFLQVPLSADKIVALLKHLSFEEMRKMKNVSLTAIYLQENDLTPDKKGTFVRKGVAGAHEKEMDEKTQKMFDEWIQKSPYFSEGVFN